MKHLTEAELKLVSIVWELGQIASGELVKECNLRYGWKKSTTYTILKKACEKQILENKDSVVYSVISQEEYNDGQKDNVIKRYFDGSLPNFLAAFIRKEKLSRAEILELEAIIEAYKEELDE